MRALPGIPSELSPGLRSVVLLGLVLSAVLALSLTCASPPDPVASTLVLRGETMGTYWVARIVVGGPDESVPEVADRRALRDAVQDELDRVNALMSNWLEDSETSRFNRHDSTEPFEVSAATLAVVREALEIGRIADGALDPTVEPLVRAHGFGGAEEGEPPADDELAELRQYVGLELLEAEPAERESEAATLRKLDPRVRIDLSSVAKGWAVDRVVERLGELGHGDLLVEVGGEVRVRGRNAEGEPWRLGIESPQPSLGPGQSVQRIVELEEGALATSGDYRNYREVRGERISHILDPRTGRPIRHRLASVSVVQPTCARADGLATALMVLGPAEGFALAVEEDVPALFLVREDDGFAERPTPRFAERFLAR